MFQDQTGYTFSAVTLGSNPLYNQSIPSVAGSIERAVSPVDSNNENIIDAGNDTQLKLEESESFLDFGVTSLDGLNKRA